MPFVAFLAALALVLPAHAQWQPRQPVRVIVPFAPGGQSDVVMRTLAPMLSESLGQPVVIENRPGAGGQVATEAAARSAPDGHTLLIGTNGPLSVESRAADELVPVTLLGTSPSLIAVHKSLGVSTLADLLAKARSAPGKLNYGSVGIGSVSQLSMEWLARAAGVDLVHVPYAGSAPAMAALMAGDVHVVSLVPTAVAPHSQSGNVKILAQVSGTRSPLLPDVPTLAEAGYAGFAVELWMAVMAPPGTPLAAVDRFNAEFTRLARDPALKVSLWDRQWIDPAAGPPADVTARIRRERELWSKARR